MMPKPYLTQNNKIKKQNAQKMFTENKWLDKKPNGVRLK